MSEVYVSVASALDGILFDGMTIAAGGFGLCGIPDRLLDAIRDAGTSELIFASNNAGIGVCTAIAEGKKVKSFDGEDHILETGIFADLSIIKGWKADESGDLIFRKTARNSPRPAFR